MPSRIKHLIAVLSLTCLMVSSGAAAQAAPIRFDAVISRTEGPPLPSLPLVIIAEADTAPPGEPPDLTRIDGFLISIKDVLPEISFMVTAGAPADRFDFLPGALTPGTSLIMDVEFRLGSDAIFIDPRVLASNSFDVLFDTRSSLGSASYHFDFDSTQADLTDAVVRLAPDEKSFDLIFRTTLRDDTNGGGSLWTASMAGDFTAVPESSTITLAALALLSLLAHGHRRRRA